MIIQGAQEPASQEPRRTEARFKDAEAGPPPGTGHDPADGGLHDALLRPHAHAPEHDAYADQPGGPRQKHEAGEEGAQGRGDEQGF